MGDDDRDLSTIDRLAEIEEKTNSDGTITVTVEEWEEVNGGSSIVVHFVTPSGDIESDRMNFPSPGDQLTDSKFYQVLQSAGLEMRNADLLEGCEVRARVDDRNRWSLDPKVPLRARLSDANVDPLNAFAALIFVATLCTMWIVTLGVLLW